MIRQRVRIYRSEKRRGHGPTRNGETLGARVLIKASAALVSSRLTRRANCASRGQQSSFPLLAHVTKCNESRCVTAGAVVSSANEQHAVGIVGQLKS